jgi:dolichol-phosphate mannosyltransferase
MRTIVVVVPTYDERENIEALIEALCGLGVPGLSVLVVDDDSPDGTGDVVRRIAARRPGVSLLARRGPRGRGAAGRDGFLRALDMGADIVVEMDADFSHDPRAVPRLIARLDEGADIVLGSRFVEGGAERDRGAVRRAVTRLANAYVRAVFGIAVRDTNSGFRAYRRDALERIDPATLTATGPAIVHEVLLRAVRARCRIAETPILFVDRARGHSKLGPLQLVQGYLMILRLRFGGRPRRPRS